MGPFVSTSKDDKTGQKKSQGRDGGHRHSERGKGECCGFQIAQGCPRGFCVASSCVLRCNIFFVCCLLGRRSLGRIQQTDINIHIAPRTQTGRRRSRVRDDDDDELVANPQHTPPGRGPFFPAIAFCWFCLAVFWTAKGSLPACARARGGGGGGGSCPPRGSLCVCCSGNRANSI